MSSNPAFASAFLSSTVGRVAEAQLGKMLQPKRVGAADKEVPYLRAGSLEDMTADAALKKMWVSPADRTRYGVRGGDLVIAEGGDVGRSAFVPNVPDDTIIQNSLHRIRPREGDVRFLKYSLDAVYFSGWLEVLCNRATFGHLTREKLSAIRIPWPTTLQQRAIADFLDAETARIDALIAKKRRLIELASVRVWNDFETIVDSLRAKQVSLRRCIRMINDGPFGSAFRAEDYSESGAFVVRLGNIRFGEFKDDDSVYIPLELYSHFLRHRVRPGDLLIAGLGDDHNHAGRACVAPDLGRAIVKGKCFCAQIDTAMADSYYLALFLSSRLGAEAIGVQARGSTRTMINLEIAKAVALPLPSVQRQREIVQRFRVQMSRARRLIDMLSRQLDLLAEHRQALITAAVTGQLKVPGAAA